MCDPTDNPLFGEAVRAALADPLEPPYSLVEALGEIQDEDD